MDGLKDDEKANESEEDAVGKPRDGFDARVTVRKLGVAWPFGHDGRKETHGEGEAVKEHVNRYSKAKWEMRICLGQLTRWGEYKVQRTKQKEVENVQSLISPRLFVHTPYIICTNI